MEPGNHPADDKWAGAFVFVVVPELRDSDHRVHAAGSARSGSADCQAEPTDKGDDRASADDEGNPGAQQERQAEGVPGNYAALPGAGGESARLPGADVHTVPDMDRAVPGYHPDGSFQPGKPRGAFETPLRVAAERTQRNSHQQQFSLDGPGASGPDSVRDAGSGRRVHVGHAEDDHHADGGRAAGFHEQDDALDDAGDVRVLHAELPERPCGLLGRVQRGRGGDTGLRDRLGPHVESFQVQARRGRG